MKSKPPKEIRERRESNRRPETKTSQLTHSFWKKWEFRIGTGLGLAGLLLTALQYQSRPTASLGTPLDPRQVLTTPITISNDGLTDLMDMRIESFFKEMKYGHAQVANFRGRNPLDRISELTPGEKEDVLPYRMIAFADANSIPQVEALDFALVVKFRPAYWPWGKKRFFRFTVNRNYDGTARLRAMAAGDIEDAYDENERKIEELKKH